MLPKFLGKNELPYQKALYNYLKNKSNIVDNNTLKKKYMELYKKLYLRYTDDESNKTFSTPPEVSGELNIDIQIEIMNKKILDLKREIIKNYYLLRKTVYRPEDTKLWFYDNTFINDSNKNQLPALQEVKKLLETLKIVDNQGCFINENDFVKPYNYKLESKNKIILNEYN